MQEDSRVELVVQKRCRQWDLDEMMDDPVDLWLQAVNRSERQQSAQKNRMDAAISAASVLFRDFLDLSVDELRTSVQQIADLVLATELKHQPDVVV